MPVFEPDIAAAEGEKGSALLTLEKPFVGRGDAVDWAGSLTLILSASILIITLLVAILERRRGRPALISSLRFTGLCVLPVLILFLGSFTTLEGAKRTEFCHSCHSAMDLYVSDMRDTSSTTLAAVHYNNRLIPREECYSCHADYSIWGTTEAKMRGLFHLYHWFANSPTARGEEQITLYKSYQNSLCLYCHAGSQRFLESGQRAHLKFADALLGTNAQTGAPLMPCGTCHGPAHPKLADRRKDVNRQ
ncbi:MAG: NapC/NirT family cytochrome c [Thermodesulfobacteriota bacterium]|jgi:nitrate/TMAO reductase-like tetraheme cytochrome c subunit